MKGIKAGVGTEAVSILSFMSELVMLSYVMLYVKIPHRIMKTSNVQLIISPGGNPGAPEENTTPARSFSVTVQVGY